MKKYFFGYLFVRIAKFLAVVIVLIGLAYAIFQFAQASIAAESVQYLPNPTVRQHLDKLLTRFFEAQSLVSDLRTRQN